jgi:hypothetical protein
MLGHHHQSEADHDPTLRDDADGGDALDRLLTWC